MSGVLMMSTPILAFLELLIGNQYSSRQCKAEVTKRWKSDTANIFDQHVRKTCRCTSENKTNDLRKQQNPFERPQAFLNKGGKVSGICSFFFETKNPVNHRPTCLPISGD